MAVKELIVVLAIAAATATAIAVAVSQPAQAAGQFCCPYGDRLCFDTLLTLQEHVLTAHPGQAIPLDIRLE